MFHLQTWLPAKISLKIFKHPVLLVLQTDRSSLWYWWRFCSVDITVHEFFFDGVLAAWHFAVGHVETKVSPLVGGCGHARRPDNTGPVRDSDCVANSKVHSLHDTLTLQLSAGGSDGRHCWGSHVAAGAKQLLPMVIMMVVGGGQLEGSTLFHVLQTSPDGKAGLLWYLQSA